MTTVIDTSTTPLATAYSNQRKIDRCQNGVLWKVSKSVGDTDGSGSSELHYSTDDGATWTQADDLSGHEQVSFFIDLDDNAHMAFRATGTGGIGMTAGNIYYRFGTPNAARTSWTWSAPTLVLDTWASYPDVVAHRDGSGWRAHVVMSYLINSSNNSVYHRDISVSSGGTVTLGTLTRISNATYNNTNHKWPSIDFSHSGDGKTVAGGAPHLYVAWSGGMAAFGNGIRFKKATYSAGTWTWGTEREIDSTRYIGVNRWLSCLFDGTRVVIAGMLNKDSGDSLVIYERDAADTTTTTRVLIETITHGTDALVSGSATFDGDGNVYLFGGRSGSSPWELDYRKWDRATATLEAAVELDAGTQQTPRVSTKRGYSNGRIEYVYTDGTASPYSVTYGSILLNTAPNAPTQVSPIGGVTVDRTAPITLDWTFSDPDAGDTQSAADVEVRVQGGATVITDSVLTPTEYVVPASTLAAGTHEWRARTYDSQGAVGPWSGWAPFVAATPPATPTITDPTVDQTIGSETYTVGWSAPSQDAYQVRRVADAAGSPDTGTVYSDTGTVVSSSARSRSVTFDTNNRTEHVQVRVRSSGLWSPWATVRVQVAYTTPPAPTVTATPLPGDGVIRVAWTNPAPVGDEPATESVRVYRTTGGVETLIAVGAADSSYDDPNAGARTDHTYRVVTVGDNGTTATSASTAAVRLPLSGVWLHPANDPSALRQHRRNDQGGTRTSRAEQTVRRYAGREYPAVEYGEGRDRDVEVTVHVVDEAALDALLDLEGRVVRYRDAAGRSTFGTLDRIVDAAAFYGWDVSFTVTAVDHDESVAP